VADGADVLSAVHCMLMLGIPDGAKSRRNGRRFGSDERHSFFILTVFIKVHSHVLHCTALHKEIHWLTSSHTVQCGAA